MRNHLHHVHLFASNLAASIDFYTGALGGEVVLDAERPAAAPWAGQVSTGSC